MDGVATQCPQEGGEEKGEDPPVIIDDHFKMGLPDLLRVGGGEDPFQVPFEEVGDVKDFADPVRCYAPVFFGKEALLDLALQIPADRKAFLIQKLHQDAIAVSGGDPQVGPAGGAQDGQGVPGNRGGGNPQVENIDPGGEKTGDHRPLQRPGRPRIIGAYHHLRFLRQ